MSLARAETAHFADGRSLARPIPAPASPAVAPLPPVPPGGVFFVAPTRQAEACAELRARRYVVVAPPPLSPASGKLRQMVEDAVEGALAMRGALPPGTPSSADAAAIVRDQVVRARALGAAGVAIALPSFAFAGGTLGEPDRVLGLEDGALISAWVAAAQRGAVILLLDERDREIRVLSPRRLGELASSMAAPRWSPWPASFEAPASSDAPPPPPSGEVAKAVAPVVTPFVAPIVLKSVTSVSDVAVSATLVAVVDAPIAAVATASMATAAEEEEPPTQRYRERPPPPIMAMPRRGVMKKRSRVDAAPEPEAAPALEAAPEPEAAPTLEAIAPAIVAPPPPVVAAPPTASEAVAPPAEAPLPTASPIPGRLGKAPMNALRKRPRLAPVAALPEKAPPEKAPPEAMAPEAMLLEVDDKTAFDDLPPPPEPQGVARRVANAAEWRAHAVELDKARGPKPVSVIDKLFATRYMPLLGALARGEVDAPVRAVIDGFRTNFEHSYREGFAALRVTGKRPPMVFDAPEIAARTGRLNGARAVKLFLVDAMRFDVGERVAARLGERLAGRAVCVDRTLLWSAIPTTTQTQMTLLARGEAALRDAELPIDPEAEIVRGRAVATVRRERIGSREVMKLDLLEARLRAAGASYEDRLESLAEEVAQVTVRYVETLPPRTLLFVFGDHGFRLPATPDGRTTGAATQGGVSPEEVLVPGYAWLTGGVH
jgi:hypothetical protein